MEFWPGVTIQRGIMTRLHIFYSTQEGVKIQKRDPELRRVIIQRKIHLIFTPGRYSIGGQNFILHRLREDTGGLSREYVLRIPSMS